MPRNSAKANQTLPKKRGPYTPQPVQVRVIARHMDGQSNRRIASAEGLARETVGHILSRQEIVDTNARQWSRLQRMGVPRPRFAPVTRAMEFSIFMIHCDATGHLVGVAEVEFVEWTPDKHLRLSRFVALTEEST